MINVKDKLPEIKQALQNKKSFFVLGDGFIIRCFSNGTFILEYNFKYSNLELTESYSLVIKDLDDDKAITQAIHSALSVISTDIEDYIAQLKAEFYFVEKIVENLYN